MSRTYSYLATVVGVVCIYFLVRTAISPQNMILRNAIIQGVLIGFGLAFVSAQIYASVKSKKVNGWVTMYGLGRPSNGMFLRTAHAQYFPGPVNTPEEAMRILGRVLVYSDSDLATAYNLTITIKLTSIDR